MYNVTVNCGDTGNSSAMEAEKSMDAVGSSYGKTMEKSSIYMNALGRYTAWRTDVDLEPPPQPKHLPRAFKFKCAGLSNADKTSLTRKSVKSDISLALVSSASTTRGNELQKSNDKRESSRKSSLIREDEHRRLTLTENEKHSVQSYYNALQYILYETGRPETKCKIKREDSGIKTEAEIAKLSQDRVTIVAFSSPVDCMGMLLEGGRQCPGDMLLVLSRTWISRLRDDGEGEGDGRPTFSLYVHKAIVFKSGGRTELKCFDPPRRVTYLLNQLTSDCTSGLCRDGDELEENLSCPTNITMKVGHLLDDKLWSRIKMAEVGVAFPETLAFAYRPVTRYRTEGLELITVVKLDNKTENLDLIMQNIQRFLSSPYMARHDMIVVKPSGAMWSASVGVTFHERTEVVDIYNAVLELLQQLVEGDCILVETFCETLKRKITSEDEAEDDGVKPIDWRASDEYSSRVRATVMQGSSGQPYCSQIVCGTWYRGSAVNGDNTVPSSVDTTLIMFGVTDVSERQRVERQVRADSQRLHAVISDHVSAMSAEEKGAALSHCDIIGIDYMLVDIRGQITPVGIELNGPNCTVNCDIAEFVHGRKSGETYREVIQSMIHRSQCFIMREKSIVVIGADLTSHDAVLETASELGVKMIVVTPDVTVRSSSSCPALFISYDFSDHSQDTTHAANITKCLEEKRVSADGFITFIDTCVPLVGRLSELHSLNGPGFESAQESLSISATQQRVLDSSAGIPHLPLTSLYALKQIRSLEQQEFELVNMLKYSGDTVIVGDKRDGPDGGRNKQMYGARSTSGHKGNSRRFDIIHAMRHRVVLIQHKRKIVASFVYDVAACDRRANDSAEHLMTRMPSGLCDDVVDQLARAASQCCVEVGLISGVFMAELWLTPTGPKLLRIDPLLESLYVRDWIIKLYGVDILLAGFLISCDIAPLTFQFLSKPQVKIFGFITNQLYNDVQVEDIIVEMLSSNKCGTNVGNIRSVSKSTSVGSLSPMSSYSNTPSTTKYSKSSADRLSSNYTSHLNSPRNRPALVSRSYSTSFTKRPSGDACNAGGLIRNNVSDDLARAVSNKLSAVTQPKTGLNLLKVLYDNDVVEVVWLSGDVALARPACLMYCVESDLEVAMNKVSGVLSIVGVDYNSSALWEFISELDAFKTFT